LSFRRPYLVAAAYCIDLIEVGGKRGVEGVVGFAVVVDAWNGNVVCKMAGIKHDSVERLRANSCQQPLCEERQLDTRKNLALIMGL
jgi:hypothetical protein